jgi:hypothetical protein
MLGIEGVSLPNLADKNTGKVGQIMMMEQNVPYRQYVNYKVNHLEANKYKVALNTK